MIFLNESLWYFYENLWFFMKNMIFYDFFMVLKKKYWFLSFEESYDFLMLFF